MTTGFSRLKDSMKLRQFRIKSWKFFINMKSTINRRKFKKRKKFRRSRFKKRKLRALMKSCKELGGFLKISKR